MILEQLIVAIQVAIVAWVFTFRLTGKGEALYVWRWFLTDVLKIRSQYVLNPILNCEYCIAGQISLWLYMGLWEYNLLQHVFFVAVTIFIVELINRLCPQN